MSMPPIADINLRDWFAGQLIAFVYTECSKLTRVTYGEIAKECYDMADAMIIERERCNEFDEHLAKIRENEK